MFSTAKVGLLKLDPSIPSHAFFLENYMKFPADPTFCENGVFQHFSSTISLPPGPSQAPRASSLRRLPKKFRNLFKAQSTSLEVSSIQNACLAFQPGGGLDLDDNLPSETHILLNAFLYSTAFKNSTTSLISQFISFVQGGLKDLDLVLLNYSSPIYNCCPLRLKSYKNGKEEVLKNKEHPLFEKWESLINRVHFDDSYATTRLTFP
jgi:hypothetical protein